jgi:D-alanine-D-alanine ligase
LDYHWFYGVQWINDGEAVITKIKDKVKDPLRVKPGNLGSSIGVSVVINDSELEDGIDLAIRLAAKVLVEPKITNLKEVNCSVLGDRDQNEVSVCEEPISSEFILSYNDKYAGGLKGKGGIKTAGGGMSNAKRKIPAEISEEMSKGIQGVAKKAFVELNCNGVVRIDFLIDQDKDEIYLCELNTIPGSLAFYLWDPLGKSFTDLTDRLIELALKRYREVNNLIVSYEDNILRNW